MSTTETEVRKGMNDGAGTDDTTAQAESQARQAGWVPKEEFRGDPAKWVDATQYLQINGHLRTDRDRIRSDLDNVKQQNATLQAQLRAQQAALDALQETVVETKTVDLSGREAELTAQIKAARTANDFEEEERLRDERDKVRREKEKLAVDKTGGGAQTTSTIPTDPVNTPEFRQFLSDNPWFETDKVMAAASVAILAELNASGVTKNLTPSQRYALAAQKTKERFGIADTRGAQRMEGSRGGGDAGGTDGTGKSYADLPPEAKAACDRQAQRVVGQGKKFKTEAEWRKSYAATYFK